MPRSESYVKQFRPLPLGVLPLDAGRGLLTLRAIEIPGQQAVVRKERRVSLAVIV